jgi:hypothetical protein
VPDFYPRRKVLETLTYELQTELQMGGWRKETWAGKRDCRDDTGKLEGSTCKRH